MTPACDAKRTLNVLVPRTSCMNSTVKRVLGMNTGIMLQHALVLSAPSARIGCIHLVDSGRREYKTTLFDDPIGG